MAEPNLVAYSANIALIASASTTASFTWQSGDVFHILGITEDNGSTTLTLPTTAGSNMGTVSNITTTNTASSCKAYYWRATATGSGSGTFSSNIDNVGAAGGIAVWQYRATDGQGTPATRLGTADLTVDVTRGQVNSHVISIQGDWNQTADVTTDPTPATNANERQAEAFTGKCDVFVNSWGDQSGTGTTAYGITNHSGGAKMTQIAVEIFGSSGGVTNASTTPTGASSTGVVGGITIEVRPPPPYTLTRVTW